ncbi:MAG: EF-hand domain-containing protein [Akkermansiaceae bacterium]|nr:EF-hand domain-containing protein [Akkermansiaceae bacterium]
MKKTTRLIITAITGTFISSMCANAENIEGNAKDFRAKAAQAPPKRILDKFDQDGDGLLSESERNNLKQAMSQRREAVKAKMLKRFDSDQDGQLSPEEKNAAAPILAEERKKIKAAIVEQFDKDNDGKLSIDERKGSREWLKQNHPDAFALRKAKACFGKGPRGQKREAKKNKLN